MQVEIWTAEFRSLERKRQEDEKKSGIPHLKSGIPSGLPLSSVCLQN